jgi:hypothetical protein
MTGENKKKSFMPDKKAILSVREGGTVLLNGREMFVRKVGGMNHNIARNSIGLELADRQNGSEFFLEFGLDAFSRPFLCEIYRLPERPEKWVRKKKLALSTLDVIR